MAVRPRQCLAVLVLVLVATTACRRTPDAPRDGRTAVWLDISPAFGDPPRDPGDALALLQAFGSDRLHVRGVSVTFGNVPLVRGFPSAQELMKRIDTGLLRPWRGASSAEERAAPTEATELLEEALSKERLTVVAVGPATTLASVLLRHPEMASRIERVVVVAGQTPAAGGAVRTDANVAADADSLQAVLSSTVPVTLVAGDLATGVGLNGADLDRLDTGRGPIKLITPSSRLWLEELTSRTGAQTFAVPAMLAVDVAAHPGQLRCEAAIATLTGDAASRSLLVSSTPGAPGRAVTWCHTADPDAKTRIIADVLRLQPLQP